MAQKSHFDVPELGEFPRLGIQLKSQSHPASLTSSHKRISFSNNQRISHQTSPCVFDYRRKQSLKQFERSKHNKFESIRAVDQNISTASLASGRVRSASVHSLVLFCSPHCCGPDEKLLSVYYEEGGYKTIVVNERMRAIDVCNIMLEKCHLDKNDLSVNWQLYEEMEVLPDHERPLEDHEFIFDIGDRWPGLRGANRVWFRPNPSKYNLSEDMERMLLRTDSLNVAQSQQNSGAKVRPLSEGLIWLKRPNCKWAKVFCFLAMSAIFFSKKCLKKNARFLTDLVSMDTFVCRGERRASVASDLLDQAPTPHNLVIVPSSIGFLDSGAIFIFATKSRADLESWAEGMRLHKHGRQKLEANLAKAVAIEPQSNFPPEYFNLNHDAIGNQDVGTSSLDSYKLEVPTISASSGVVYEDGFLSLHIQTAEGILKLKIDITFDRGEHCFKLRGHNEKFPTLDELLSYCKSLPNLFKLHALAHQNSSEINFTESSSF